MSVVDHRSFREPPSLAIDLAQSRVGLAAVKWKYNLTDAQSACRLDEAAIRDAELLREYYRRQLELAQSAAPSEAIEPADDLQRALRDLAAKYRASVPEIRDREVVERFVGLLERFIANTLTAPDAETLIKLLNQLAPVSEARGFGALA